MSDLLHFVLKFKINRLFMLDSLRLLILLFERSSRVKYGISLTLNSVSWFYWRLSSSNAGALMLLHCVI